MIRDLLFGLTSMLVGASIMLGVMDRFPPEPRVRFTLIPVTAPKGCMVRLETLPVGAFPQVVEQARLIGDGSSWCRQ